MNLEIKKLLLQVAPRSGEDGEYLPSLHTPEDIERFAELIVKECISTLEEKIHRSIDNEGDETWPDLILKEHFGVEE